MDLKGYFFGVTLFFAALTAFVVRAQSFQDDGNDIVRQDRRWRTLPQDQSTMWSLNYKIPMTPEFQEARTAVEDRGKLKYKKKFKKFLLPLLLAYKLKFFTLIPVLIGGLVLLVGATGLAGFFFALFAAVMGLKTGGH